MKEFVKKNIVWLIIIGILCSLLFVNYQNSNLTTNDSKIYKTVSTKKEAATVMNVPDTIIKTFTKIKTITKYVDKVNIDTIEIRYKDTIEADFDLIGRVSTNEYSFNYNSTNKGLKVSNFYMEDSLTIITGTKRKWFLGKQENVIDILHSNKFIKTDNVNHVDISPKKKFYETTLFKFAVGFGVGVLIVK